MHSDIQKVLNRVWLKWNEFLDKIEDLKMLLTNTVMIYSYSFDDSMTFQSSWTTYTIECKIAMNGS